VSSPITTHVLDTARGLPAAGVRVTLARETSPGTWARAGQGSTDADGRLRTLLTPGELAAGAYRIVFDAGAYFEGQGVEAFWREIAIEFVVRDGTRHFHVPLLLSPFGYSTYRGS
jgi:5-hydroxyisourate hydrolase